VVGLVRNVAETIAKIKPWNRSNIHIIEGDLMNYESLKTAVELTSKITGGKLDVIIANAGLIPKWSPFDPLSVLGHDPVMLDNTLLETFKTNCIGNIHLFNIFMPLILKGKDKKVITISSGMADTELTTNFNLYEGGPYSISKAAMNMAIAKFQAEYSEQGVLFMGICPGSVDVGQYEDCMNSTTVYEGYRMLMK
jgi:NAD(P)-dependent dehydrogenase (short-subunit alcohol dehydrogenase family)